VVPAALHPVEGEDNCHEFHADDYGIVGDGEKRERERQHLF
jgi:hypothetical protein